MNDAKADNTTGNITGNTPGNAPGNLWIRLLYMILFLLIYSVSETIVLLTTLVAFGFRLFGKSVPERVLWVGRSFARFIQQVIVFLTFNTEEPPFPFSAWPTDLPLARVDD